MEYLAPEHHNIAKMGLNELRGKLRSAQQHVLDNLKSKPEGYPIDRAFRMAQEYTHRSLPTASLIWQYLLEVTENRQQKFAVMDELFHVQIATGPWNDALETAKILFSETMEFHSASRKTSIQGSLADHSLIEQQLFKACMNLGSIHRLLKELHTAEEMYQKARETAASMQDVDKEIFAKIHLAVCLLDRGELKQAIETYFNPLMIYKSSMSKCTRAVYLRYYGGACRSAADWGRAKQYLREALELAKEAKNAGLVSSCCGELGNVFRSEGRYKDAERLHETHYEIALIRGDIHNLAVASGNIGFLKFYNPEEFNDSLVYQFIEYSLAQQIGDFARMGITFNKIGKLYTTLGFYKEAENLFKIALEHARRAENVAGEGMAWGNLGTVYRALHQFENAIDCHIRYRDNAERRLDIGGVAIMQHQLAMDYYLRGNLQDAESSILGAFNTLEQIRAQIGEEDESKLSNYEKNQAEAYNLLQVVLVAQKKYKEAFVLADRSRGRALSEIVQKRLLGSTSSETETRYLNEEFINESFNNLLEVGFKLSTTLVLYSVVKEFDQNGAVYSWVYTWVLQPMGELHFSKTILQDGIDRKVELNDDFILSLRRSLGLQSQSDTVSEILRSEKLLGVRKQRKTQLPTQNDEVLESLNDLKEMFSSDWKCDSNTFSVGNHSLLDSPCKAKGKETKGNPAFKNDVDANAISVAKPIAQTDTDPISGQEINHGIEDVDSKDNPYSEIEESLPESPPTSLQKQNSPKRYSEDISSPPITGEPQSGQFNEKYIGSPSATAAGTSSLVKRKDEKTAEMDVLGIHVSFKEEESESESSFIEVTKANEDQSFILINSSNAVEQITTVTVDSLTRDRQKLCTVTVAVEDVPVESPDLNQYQEISEIFEVRNYKASIPTICTDIKATVLDCMTPDNDATIAAGAPTTHLQSADHTKIAEFMQDPLPLNNSVSEDACPGLKNDAPAHSTHSLETVTIESSTNPVQIGNHAEKHEDTEYPLSTNNYRSMDTMPSASNNLQTDVSSIYSMETVSTEAFPTPVASSNCTLLGEDKPDPTVTIDDFRKDTPFGLVSDTLTCTDSSVSNQTTSTEDSINANDTEEEKNNLATLVDVSESSSNRLTNDDISAPSDLQDDPELAPWRPMLNQVYKILIEPIKDFLPKNDKNARITFIPQDFLLKVPFAALQGATEHRYVMEDFVISTSPAIHFLDLARATRERTGRSTSSEFSLLAVGNPKMPFSDVPQLPSAEREVHMISKLFSSEDLELFVGTHATKKNVLAAMPSHSILHFATHAVIDDSDAHGDFSMKGLIFLAKSGDQCNGLLTAEEVKAMELRAELVVLSCCNTGLGKVTGDGVLGLSRAFLAAGAACVVVTLWKIDDDSAFELMTSFYLEYKETRDAAVSLQSAMKILQAKEKTRSPQHWAAFSIVGCTGYRYNCN